MTFGRPKYNPWAQSVDTEAPAAMKRETQETSRGVILGDVPALEPLDTEAELPPAQVNIAVKPYGGLVIKGASTPTEGILRLFEWCMPRRIELDSALTDASLLIIELESIPAGGFFVQRPDGWTFCVPHAQNRDQGLIQVVQFVQALSRNPLFSSSLESAGISAYRM